LAGVLSAYGMGLAEIRSHRHEAVEELLGPKLIGNLKRVAKKLAAATGDELKVQGVAKKQMKTSERVHLRYAGTDTSLIVDLAGAPKMRHDFEQAHRQQYGFVTREKQLIVEAVSVEC